MIYLIFIMVEWFNYFPRTIRDHICVYSLEWQLATTVANRQIKKKEKKKTSRMSKRVQQEIQVGSHHSTTLCPHHTVWLTGDLWGVPHTRTQSHRHARLVMRAYQIKKRWKINNDNPSSWHYTWMQYQKLLKKFFFSFFFIYLFSALTLLSNTLLHCLGTNMLVYVCEMSCHPIFIDLTMGVWRMKPRRARDQTMAINLYATASV